ncbi:MAG: DUF1501 domain-containing protein [Planctomycetales bacterium]|nr:DUF1501 domain-containing protein [Planctomycetales bacterium]
MLRILGTRRALCDGLSRRDLLQIGGLAGLGLAGAMVPTAARAEKSLPGSRGLHAKSFGRAKSCIFLFPYGSPSSHETFDPKPEAPAEIQGEMKAISTNVPGLAICDHLPNTAKVMDQVTVVRSMTHPYPLHCMAYAVTGIPTYTTDLETQARDSRHWPFIGSVVDYLEHKLNGGAAQIPRNIGLPWLVNSKTDNPAVNAGPFAAFLGRKHDPVWTDFDGPGLRLAPKNTVGQAKQFLDPNGGTTLEGRFTFSPSAPSGGEASKSPPIADLSLERLSLRRSLLAQFDDSRRRLDESPAVQGMDHDRQLAWSLLTSNKLRGALDIGQEPRQLREAYGLTLFGQSCLAARRLVEAGGRFVTVFWDCYGQFANAAWDTHQYHYPRMKELLLPGFDLAYPALIRDLSSRGLLDETLVIWMSEHGRTPRLDSGKPGSGRDHWSRAYSVALAGGGIARGKVVGQTTRDGGDVLDCPVSPKDILATAFHLLGIDAETTVPDLSGRPHPIAGDGKVRIELLG